MFPYDVITKLSPVNRLYRQSTSFLLIECLPLLWSSCTDVRPFLSSPHHFNTLVWFTAPSPYAIFTHYKPQPEFFPSKRDNEFRTAGDYIDNFHETYCRVDNSQRTDLEPVSLRRGGIRLHGSKANMSKKNPFGRGNFSTRTFWTCLV